MNREIVIPSIESVREYLNKFDRNKELVVVEDVLAELFARYPGNQNLRDVLIKATVLNALYSTNIYDIVKMANHILSKNIGAKLQMGSPELVDEIARVEMSGKIRNNYSFASKFCHWHKPDMYPIFDGYVEQLLWAYREQSSFMEFKRDDLRKYPRYKEIIEGFKNHYGLTQFSLRELDKFLWGYGRQLFETKQ